MISEGEVMFKWRSRGEASFKRKVLIELSERIPS